MGSYAEGSDCDVLIVGAGIFGASTAYHLASRVVDPSRILVLDRAPVPSPQAASSDINKIVRADYSKKFYMDLAYEAMDAWYDLPFLKPFYHQTGWVMVDERGSDLADRIRANFKKAGRPDTSKDVTLDRVKTSWGGVLRNLDTTDYDKAYTNSSAGWADASLAVEAMVREAIGKGVRYEVGEIIDLLATSGRLQSVKVRDGRCFTAQKILLATGAWTPWLMSSLEHALDIKAENSINKQIQTAGVCTAAFRVSKDDAEYYGQMPVLIYGARGEAMPPNKDEMFKFTNANTFTNFETHSSGQIVSVPRGDQGYVPQRLKDQSIELVRKRVPSVLTTRQEPVWRLCWDTVSPDQSQLICQHPDPRLSNLYLATAGSFHSWKFLPVIGKYVANVIEGKSNGEERDKEWQWKRAWTERGAHEKVKPRNDLRDFEDETRRLC